jgi:hypothetical protein
MEEKKLEKYYPISGTELDVIQTALWECSTKHGPMTKRKGAALAALHRAIDRCEYPEEDAPNTRQIDLFHIICLDVLKKGSTETIGYVHPLIANTEFEQMFREIMDSACKIMEVYGFISQGELIVRPDT